MRMSKRCSIGILTVVLGLTTLACAQQKNVKIWITTGDGMSLLRESPEALSAGTENTGLPAVTVNPANKFQPIDGFGFSLTGGSALLIMFTE